LRCNFPGQKESIDFIKIVIDAERKSQRNGFKLIACVDVYFCCGPVVCIGKRVMNDPGFKSERARGKGVGGGQVDFRKFVFRPVGIGEVIISPYVECKGAGLASGFGDCHRGLKHGVVIDDKPAPDIIRAEIE